TRTILRYILLLLNPSIRFSPNPPISKPLTPPSSPSHPTPQPHTNPSRRDLQPLALIPHSPSRTPSLNPRTLRALTVPLPLSPLPSTPHRSLDAAYDPTPYLNFRVGRREVRIRSPIALGWEGVKLWALGVQLWVRLVVVGVCEGGGVAEGGEVEWGRVFGGRGRIG
ncbi:MAG: hypothetical protein Q9204_008552, partial [Flavoplaca sp. TL-2023a]